MRSRWILLINSIRNEWQRIITDKDLVLLLLIVPLFYTWFYGGVYQHKKIQTIHVGILDQDNSSVSHLIIKRLEQDPVLRLHYYADFSELKEEMYRNNIQAAVILPNDAEKNLKNGRQVNLPVFISAINFMVNIEANKHIGTILQTTGGEIAGRYWLTRGIGRNNAMVKVSPIDVSIHPVGNPVYSYGDFVLTGLFILIIQQLVLIATAMSMPARRIEQGKLSEFYSGVQWIGLMVPYLCLVLLYLVADLVLFFPYFRMVQKGSLLAISLLAVFFSVAIVSLGMLVGSFFRKKYQVLIALSLTSVPIFLMSGYSWPYAALPVELKAVNFLLPTYWMMQSFQNMTHLGAGLATQWKYGCILFVQSGAYFLLFRWRMNRIGAANDVP